MGLSLISKDNIDGKDATLYEGNKYIYKYINMDFIIEYIYIGSKLTGYLLCVIVGFCWYS